MERRTLIALALSFLVLGLYPVFLETFYPQYAKKALPRSGAAKTAVTQKQTQAPGAVLKAEELSPIDDIAYKNGKFALTFNQKGGGIREIAFPEYVDSETKLPLRFISLKDSKAAPTSISILRDSEILSTSLPRGAKADQISLSSSALEGALKVRKSFLFKKGYSGDLSVVFENTSSKPISFHYELFAGSRITPRHTIDPQYIEADFFTNENGKKTLRHVNENRLGKEKVSASPIDWLAIKDRHFSIILKPAKEKYFSAIVRGLGNRQFSASLVSPEITIAPGATVTQDFLVYIGPTVYEELSGLGLEDIINFGKMDGIGKVLVGTLELLNNIFHNYGVAIIALTLLINLLLFPLTRTSYMSLKRMQLIQPQMNKLREQYKKNPEKLNKEMMELYRKHKVNPFGGCLPMLVQMPVFIALYVALSKSVMLINSQLLWINDLSSPDKVQLPFSLPFLTNEIHVLPLIMVAGMFFQQRLTQVQTDNQDPAMAQQQKMMTVMMPVIFGFIFYSMPSGLVIYWLTNTVLMTLYQLYLKKITLV